MSTMQIKVVAVEVTNRGKYDQAELTFKNLSFQEKVETKKIMSFVNKDVFNVIKNSSSGDVFTISRVKDDKGYWQWTGIAEGDEVPAGASVAATNAPSASVNAKVGVTPKSTYETPEERAKKQLYIVRQSSIGAAINLLKTEKVIPSVEEVLNTAKQFESYVFGVEVMPTDINSLPPLPDDDDIPY